MPTIDGNALNRLRLQLVDQPDDWITRLVYAEIGFEEEASWQREVAESLRTNTATLSCWALHNLGEIIFRGTCQKPQKGTTS